MDFRSRLDEISQQLDAETAKRETLEKMLDDSMLKDLLAKDLEVLKSARAPKRGTKVSSMKLPSTMRTYRHKSEMVGDIKNAKQEYEAAKQRLHESEAELQKLQREAKLAAAKSSVAKIKIKALLALMKKMISHSANATSGRSNVFVDGDEDSGRNNSVGHLIEQKLRNIATMIPQYNASIDEVTQLAREAVRTTGESDGGNDNIGEILSPGAVTGAEEEGGEYDGGFDDEGTWDSLIERISMRG